jgi:O-antigen ligase
MHVQHGMTRAALQPAAPPLTLPELAIGGLWIASFIVASYGATPLSQFNIERYAWIAADFAALMVVLLRHEEMLGLVRRNLVIMSWPALACASALWSVDPMYSFYQGLQLLMTVLVGLCLIMTTDLRRILILLFIALLITGVLTALLELPRGLGGREWQGVFPHKNVLGSTMGILIMTGTVLFLSGWRPLLSGLGTLFALMLLAASRSGTALVALVMVMALVPLALTIRWGSIAVTLVCGFILVLAASGLIALEATQGDFSDIYLQTLDALGKDETLTGRTILWQFAEDAIKARPWLGYGYKGFWQNHEATAVLRLVIGQDLWFSHNAFLDLAVAFGVLGPSALVLGLGVGAYRSVKAYVRNPAALLMWPILFVAMSVIYCTVEFVLFAKHSFQQILFVVAAAGLGANGRRGQSLARHRRSWTGRAISGSAAICRCRDGVEAEAPLANRRVWRLENVRVAFAPRTGGRCRWRCCSSGAGRKLHRSLPPLRSQALEHVRRLGERRPPELHLDEKERQVQQGGRARALPDR